MKQFKRFGLVVVALLCTVAMAFAAKPNIHILATGGTIAGTGSSATGTSYTAGQVAIGALLDAVPEIKDIANVTGDLVITIAKKSTTTTMDVAVSKFVEMNNKTVFLVTVTGTPEEGKAFAYGENVMYKTTAYGENVYSWLVIVDGTADLTAADAEAKITQAAATAEEVAAGYDVNETNVVDINDAQLTYDIYTGKYTDFEKVSVRKFLRADTNADKVVNSADAVVVVASSK